MKLRPTRAHLVLLATGVFAFVSGISLADQANSSSQTTKEAPQSLTNGAKAEDNSPDISTYMKEIDRVRNEPKPQAAMPEDGGTDRPIAAGPMGESEIGGGGPSGPRALPPGDAPDYEGGLRAATAN